MFDVRLIHVPTLDAYLQFRQGMEVLEGDGTKARACFTRASELDPGFVSPDVCSGPRAMCDDAERCSPTSRAPGAFTPWSASR